MSPPADAAILVEVRLAHPPTPLATQFFAHAATLFADLGATLIATLDPSIAGS